MKRIINKFNQRCSTRTRLWSSAQWQAFNLRLLSGVFLNALIIVVTTTFAFNTAWATSDAQASEQPTRDFSGEPPLLRDSVRHGLLPVLAERLPERPAVIDLNGVGLQQGRYGGQLRLLMGKAKDVRMMTVYGYARLVGFNNELQLQPDLLERIEVEDNRVFTLHLRPGHKWSDGAPFTAEDFSFWWHHVATNEDLSPYGPPKVLRQGGGLPRFDVIDATTVRYTWSQSNPYFLPAIAGASPLYIYAPAHYLKQFHANFGDKYELQALQEELGKRNWMGVFFKYNKAYKQNNPDLPTLQPWVGTTRPPSERYVFKRNPYYHRVDSAGQQLPYIDEVVINIASSSLVAAKTGSGESDLQGRYLRLDNYTFLKAGEKNNDYSVRLWKQALGSQIALYPNLNSNDPVWRKLVRDRRFRQALSLGINRYEINQVIYFGLVTETSNTLVPQSPLGADKYTTAFTEYDVDAANALLDDIGLTEYSNKGLRLMPDGRPLEIIVQTAGESTEETDVLELIHDSWLKLGIKLYSRPSQREVFRDRVFSGDAMMSVWSGIPNGLATEAIPPDDFVPSSQEQYQWPKWGQHMETNGDVGEKPDLGAATELLNYREDWLNAKDAIARKAAWDKILQIHADEVFSIGMICGVPQPVVVHNQLRNVPETGIYSWDPGAFFGMYRPETFWFDGNRTESR